VHLTEKQELVNPLRGLQHHEYGKLSAAGRKFRFNFLINGNLTVAKPFAAPIRFDE
jgi:hypothetical protein